MLRPARARPGRRITAEIERAAEAAAERGPLRRCIVTRARQDKARMIRFVVGPDHVLVADLAGRLPGRGLWLSARGDVLEIARGRGAFAKAAKAPVVVPPDLAAMVQAGLARRIGELLGLARRAGQAVAGFEKARAWLLGGRAALVLEASDGSAPERARFLGDRRAVPVVAVLSAAALGSVFGRDHVVHVAVAPGRLADAIRSEAERLAGVAGSGTAGTPAPNPGVAGRPASPGGTDGRGPASPGGRQIRVERNRSTGGHTSI
jgi:predicted RNA-binding protein YlxR (DUF448 family)